MTPSSFNRLLAKHEMLKVKYVEFYDWVSVQISKAAYNAEELEQGVAAWQPLADSMFNGTMASFRLDGEALADNAMCAAAPDLLSALKAADDALEDLRVPEAAGPDRHERVIPEVLKQIRAAVAKAEGRTP